MNNKSNIDMIQQIQFDNAIRMEHVVPQLTEDESIDLLKAKIDQALDLNDKEQFIKLTNKLNRIIAKVELL